MDCIQNSNTINTSCFFIIVTSWNGSERETNAVEENKTEAIDPDPIDQRRLSTPLTYDICNNLLVNQYNVFFLPVVLISYSGDIICSYVW